MPGSMGPSAGPIGTRNGDRRRPSLAELPEALGRSLRRAARRPEDRAADRRVGTAAVATLALVAVAPPLATLPIGWAMAGPRIVSARDVARRATLVGDQLPDVVDLLRITTLAGLPVGSALQALAHRPGGVLGGAIAAAAAHVRHGGSTGEALVILHRAAGAPVRPLVDALADHDRYGTPLGPALDRVGIESRLHRRRHAEEAARRLPVALLFPLVFTTLPAFALLTVVPLIVGSFGSLRP